MKLNWFESMLYGLFSGLTDILPVSVQAHQTLMLKFFGVKGNMELLDLLIHLAIAAALYLRNAGASPEYARTFFEEPFEDYRAEALFGSEAKIYRERIAITSIEGGDGVGGRIAAAKAADRLLTVRNVHAAFALIRMGSIVHISARSDGSINVQLILEKIGGGGHFDVAGAALAESELKEAEQLLLQAIDNYFNEEKR